MSRIVRCPKCEVLLREPSVGTPFYQCSKCAAILQAKHAKRPEPIVQEQPLEKGKFTNGPLTNGSSRYGHGVLSKAVSLGALDHTSGEDGSASVFRKDSPMYSKRSLPKTVRTIRAFSKYETNKDGCLYNARSQSYNQISSNDGAIPCSEPFSDTKTSVQEKPGLALEKSEPLFEEKEMPWFPKQLVQSELSPDHSIVDQNNNVVGNASSHLQANGSMDYNQRHSKESYTTENLAASFHYLCRQSEIKDDIENANPRGFESVLAPESCPQERNHTQSQSELSREFDFQLNSMSTANEDVIPEAKALLSIFKRLELSPFPLKSTRSEEESCGSLDEIPSLEDSVGQIRAGDACQPADLVSYLPVVRTGLPKGQVKNGGKLNSASNMTVVLSDGNNLRHEQRHRLSSQTSQRSEDLYEATSEVDEYEPSELSSNMDEADVLDSENHSQQSEDIDSSCMSQQRVGTAANTLRDYDHVATGITSNGEHRHSTLHNKLGLQGLKSNMLHQEQQTSGSSTSAQKNQQPYGQDLVNVHLQSIPQTESVDSPKPPFSRLNAFSTSSESASRCPSGKSSAVQRDHKRQVKDHPLLPLPSQAPYVLCEHCRRLLKVPLDLSPTNKYTQKLRCGACLRISVFSVQRCNFVDERSVFASPRFDSSKDAYNSSDDISILNTRSQMQALISQLKAKSSVNSVKASRSPCQTDSLNASDDSQRHSIRQGEEALQTSVGPGETLVDLHSSPVRLLSATGSTDTLLNDITQHAEFSMCKQTTVPGNVHEMDPKEPYISSIQHTRTDSDCDSSKSAEDLSWAASSPVAMSPLHELFGYESPLQVVGTPSSKDHVDGANRVVRWSVKNLLRGRKKDSSKDNHGRANIIPRKVIVNGNAISYRQVKKAEEAAGPIHPGSYWYDFRAGFWGVIGGPCIGIVAPFIEEFDYPLSRECSGGNTGVLVNGRELHHIDFDKLVLRGLPSTSGKAYKVEIDGRVIDEASGEELRGLGRLAPSIERRGCGYGMFLPVDQHTGRAELS
ncbi:hypothetical protein O6H91_15G031900 [Diphasiastrum complanatum]|uniref:Uncharacterized protein n=8 Tax=Diphasiastrum complanatum TaxID=34168 RepID=A0ACC2BH35_DIPCM|nr:hypothetical protein O6H91_15G031900 [Diphasiastrum complanatum]KAJ7529049.1 hypothetical protein O6H91_15G031900 [Diphasiastrum complanatum]KAJ7529050.1 hypothetical protein O6H91_15G031900 [Diphasiastrum complanatum]KAJ7529052.1 hypothetical protein O6H91_15G031900 [Diphasiastrum complanatum]